MNAHFSVVNGLGGCTVGGGENGRHPLLSGQSGNFQIGFGISHLFFWNLHWKLHLRQIFSRLPMMIYIIFVPIPNSSLECQQWPLLSKNSLILFSIYHAWNLSTSLSSLQWGQDFFWPWQKKTVHTIVTAGTGFRLLEIKKLYENHWYCKDIV